MATWYVRSDGGTATQSTGHTDAAYPGSGSGTASAYKEPQDAFDNCTYGDTIIIRAGDTYYPKFEVFSAPWYLPGKGTPPTDTEADRITVITSASASLPAGRVSESDTVYMPRMVSRRSGGVFMFADDNAHTAAKWWKLVGLEITNESDGTAFQYTNTMVVIGNYPGVSHAWIDRCVIHPQPFGTTGTGQATASFGIYVTSPASGANTYDTKITNNWIGGFGGVYSYSTTQPIPGQALGSNVLDTILVDNNFLSGAYDPYFPGGDDPGNVSSGVVQASPAPTLTTMTLNDATGLDIGDWFTVPSSYSPSTPINNQNAQVTGKSGNNITFTSIARLCTGANVPLTGCVAGAPEPPYVGATVLWNGDVGRNYTITRNTFDIPTAIAQYVLDNTGSSPKGYIEIKMGLNMLIEGNTFQGWPSTIAVQAVNQNGDTPWCTVTITIRNNWIKEHDRSLIFNLGNPTGDGWHRSALGSIVVDNNLFVGPNSTLDLKEMSTVYWGDNAVIKHNTFVDTDTYSGNYTVFIGALGGTGATVQDNIFWFGGASDWECAPGGIAGPLSVCLPSATIQNNVFMNRVGVVTDAFIAAIFPSSFVSSPGSHPLAWTGSDPDVITDWVVSTSEYKASGARDASDGTDVGVNIDTLAAALAGGAPLVSAGSDQSLSAGVTSTTLTATAYDPESQAMTYLWTRTSGPNSPTIVSATSLSTSVTGMIAGTYVFEFAATDTDTNVGTDDVQVVIASSGIPPVGPRPAVKLIAITM